MENDEEDHALVADKVAPTEFALMANTSAESKVFDNSLCSKDCKKNNDSLNSLLTASKDLDNLIESQRPSPTIESTSEDGQNRNPSVSEDVASPITPKPFIKKRVKKNFTPRPVAHRSYRPSQRPVITNMNDALPNRTFFNKHAYSYANRPVHRTSLVRSPYRAPWVPTVNRNYPPVIRKFSTGCRQFPTVSRKFPTASRKFPTGSTKGSTANMRRKGKAIKPSACWFWRPLQNLSNKGNISYLSDYEPFDGGYMSFGQGGCKIIGKGTIKTGKLEFENVYFVKDLKYNLFSVSQICDNKNSVLFTDSECIVLGKEFKLLDDANILLRTPRQHNMYSIDLNNIILHRDLTCLVAKASADEWKQHKASCKSKLVNSVTKPLHTLHLDLFGPTSISSISHKWYYLVVTDDFSRFTWTFFLKSKEETSGILKKFITEIKNLKDLKLKIIRCDNGGEFRNKEMNDFCSQKVIKREFSNSRTLQQNGVAEKRNRTLIEVARTMVLVNKSHNKTPYELFNGRSPAIGFLKPFGCHVMILNTLDNLGKFEEKGDEGYFIGYSMSSKAFRVFNKRTRRVEENLHVEFLENKAIEKGSGPNWLFDINTLNKSMNYVPVDAGTISTNLLGTKDAARQEVKKDVSSLRYIALPNWAHDALLEFYSIETPIPTVSSLVPTAYSTDSQEPSSVARLISKRVANQEEIPSLDNILSLTNRFEDILGVPSNSDESNGREADISNMETAITASPTPTLRIHKDHPKSQIIGPVDTPIQTRNKSKEISDALQDPSWAEDMQEELLQFKIQNVWTLVDCPIGTQEEGIDYDEVFAPVARIEAIRLFLAYASFMGFTVYQIDVKSAFLYGTIYEEVYVMQPLGFQDPKFPAKVYKVEKAMYGLHQAPRAWYGTLSKYLLKNGFRRALMHEKFQMSAMGELNFFLGLHVLQKEDGIFLFQDKYVGDILKKFGYTDVRQLQPRQQLRQNMLQMLAAVDKLCGFRISCLIMGTFKFWGVLRILMISLRLILLGEHNVDFHPMVDFIEASPLRARIGQSYALPTVADELVSPQKDVSEREACLTNSGFIADYDRTTIAKSSTLPYDSAPRVTSPTAVEGSIQQTIPELTALCTSLQRQLSVLTDKFQAQEVEINRLKEKVKLLEEREGVAAKSFRDDAPIKGRSMNEGEAATKRISDDTEEMATVLTSMDVATVLASGVVDIHTGNGSIPTASTLVKERVPTCSDVVPTASPVFATATVVTPYRRRKGKEIMIESETLKNQKAQEQIDAQVARELKEQLEREDQRRSEQIARDAEIARIHVEEELQIMIDGLDRNNETKVKDFKGKTFEEVEAKFKTVWEQFEGGVFKISKEEAVWLKRKGIRLKQEEVKKMKTLEEVPEEVYVEALQVKHPIIDWKVQTEGQRTYWKITRLGGSSASYQFFTDLLKHLDRDDLNQLWILVKETLSKRPLTSDKEMELWVELSRFGEGLPSKEGSSTCDDQLQALSGELLTYGNDLVLKIYKIANSPRHKGTKFEDSVRTKRSRASSLREDCWDLRAFNSRNLIVDAASSLREDC
nr:hypothetical protein [Tanacetum cinerariifolium]